MNSRWWRVLRKVLGGAVTIYLALCGVLFFSQRSLLYFPPPAAGGDGTAAWVLPTAAARVLVSTRPKDGPGAMIYFGGNAEDVSVSLPEFAAGFPDRAVYLLHYRGYSGSSGSPSEKALFADALTLFDAVHAQHPDVCVVGRSLGSGIAVYVASLRPLARLVLVTPYDSIQELAVEQYPYFPVRWLLLDKYESSRYAPQVKAPTLIVAAEHDEVIPRASTEALRSRFPSGLASFAVVAGTGHNDISGSPEYMRLLAGAR